MNLSVGIVGLPNAGKSTLFNALASRRLAETAPRPFTTIEPYEAVVPVPDENLEKLHNILISQYPDIKVFPATVAFIDIAGIVKGAHKGEGLGNQFLAKIREVDAIVHVVRTFEDENVSHVHGKIDPKEDVEIVNLELELGGISQKPTIYVLNVGEKDLQIPDTKLKEKVKSAIADQSLVVAICAKLEEELTDLSESERALYLNELGIKESGLEKLIKKSYELLDLITFYTIKGGREIRAWSLKRGGNAIDAAAKVHTDFAKNFIKAEVISVYELLAAGGWRKAKDKGKVRLEGKDYIVEDEDIIEFKVGI